MQGKTTINNNFDYPWKAVSYTIPTTHILYVKRPKQSQLNWAILLCDVIPDGKTE
jgi:hypothetical protein